MSERRELPSSLVRLKAWLATRPRRATAATILFGTLMLMTTTAVIGRPSVFTDTDDYYAQGRSIMRALDQRLHHNKPIINWDDVHYRATHPDSGDQEPVHNQDGARSAYYGLALYLLQKLGTLWLLAFAQSAVAASLMYALWRASAPAAPRRTYVALMGVLVTVSTLPIFTGFAMPDIFAGFSAVSTVLLMVYPDRFKWPGQLLLWVLLVAAMNFHTSNLITAAGLTFASLAVLVVFKASWGDILKRAGTVLAAAAVALAGSSLYAKLVELRSGDLLGHPPFLTARVLADGPGRLFLAHACRSGSPFVVCAFKWLPLDDSEDILWSDDPERGIFNLSEFTVRQKMEQEDARFALASTLNDPVGQAVVSLDNWRQQVFNVRLDEPLLNPGFYLHDPYWKTTNLPKLIKGTGAWCGRRPGNCRVWFDPQALAILDGVVAFLAAGAALFRLYQVGLMRLWARQDFNDPLFRASIATLLLLTAVLLNAAVCGALSGPFPRYQARIVWLFTAAAVIYEIALRSQQAPVKALELGEKAR